MPVFNKLYEARNWFRDYKPSDEKVPWFSYRSDLTYHFGDWVLFQHIKYSNNQTVMSRPIFGICVGFTVWDQALVLEFVENTRAWESFSFLSGEFDSEEPISHKDREIQHFQFWTENIKPLGIWKSRPTITELREALKPLYDKV